MNQEESSNVTDSTDKLTGERTRITQVAGDITGRRWCGYHQGYTDSLTGQFIERNGKRWMCFGCLVRRGLAQG